MTVIRRHQAIATTAVWTGVVWCCAMLFALPLWGQAPGDPADEWEIEKVQKPKPVINDAGEAPTPGYFGDDRVSAIGPTPVILDEDWLSHTKVGYDEGFVISSDRQVKLGTADDDFTLRINGWGQLRQTTLASENPARNDLNQFQLKRGRVILAGKAFSDHCAYFVQLDGRSSSGDDMRLLDYYFSFDFGNRLWGLNRGTATLRVGKYKMPFHRARDLSGKEFEFTDRSVASTFFDVNRSLAWGVYGEARHLRVPLHWEFAVFNGLVTGGAETGSAGTIDNNSACSARLEWYPTGEWGADGMADFEGHCIPATRCGLGYAVTTIEDFGTTEFQSVRVVDSGRRLSSLLPPTVSQYDVSLFSMDAGLKYYGWSVTGEYYFRVISGIEGANIGSLFDHGMWLQVGKFVVPERVQLFTRWSRVVGDSGTLGIMDQSADEIAGGFAWYMEEQHVKLVADVTNINGSPVNSAALDLSPGDDGWLFRTQLQFAF